MRLHHRSVVGFVTALVIAAPTPSRADESPSPAVVVRVPPSLDLPRGSIPRAGDVVARRPALPPFAPTPKNARLSEEGMVLVVASIVVGAVVLVYLVSTATK